MLNDILKDDYNLNSLVEVFPLYDSFSFFAPPRFKKNYENGYEKFSARLVFNWVKQSNLFIDVGANYGYYSLLAASANPKITIYAFEPVKENYDILNKNFEYNKIQKNRYKCYKKAVSYEKGEVDFYKSEASDNCSVLPHPCSGTLEKIKVPTISLDDVLKNNKAKHIFIKQDTDGNELSILYGLSKSLEAVYDITLLVEINPKMLLLAGVSTIEVVHFLEKNDYILFGIDDEESNFLCLSDRDNLRYFENRFEKDYYNVFCVRKQNVVRSDFSFNVDSVSKLDTEIKKYIFSLAEKKVLCKAFFPDDLSDTEELTKAGIAVCGPEIYRLKSGESILFYGKKYNANKYVKMGISGKEEHFSWTEGKVLKLKVLLSDIQPESVVQVTFDLTNVFGKQNVSIILNNANVYKNVISAGDNIIFDFTLPEDKIIDISVDLPDACSPKILGQSEDGRDLALAIKSISFKTGEK